MNSYSEPKNAKKYWEFLDSEEGQTQRNLIWHAVAPRVVGEKILDAACGTGWFAGKLGGNVIGCDASPALIAQARAQFPNVHFDVADLSAKNLPYAPENFSTIVLNMALHDFADADTVLKNLHSLLARDGTLIATIANPYYSFPVGAWKRGVLFWKKPTLKLRDYGALARNPDRSFKWHSGNTSYFYTLPEMVSAALAAGFVITKMTDVMADADAKNFGRQYKMFRYPLVLLLELKRS